MGTAAAELTTTLRRPWARLKKLFRRRFGLYALEFSFKLDFNILVYLEL